MDKLIDVVKRGKRPTEPFDRSKLYHSVTAACLSVRTPSGQTEDIANAVCERILVWGKDKPEVTTTDLRLQATQVLQALHPEAAYFYQHYTHIM